MTKRLFPHRSNMFVSYSFKLQNSRQTLTNTIGRERREDAVGCHDNHGGDEVRDGHSERHGTDTLTGYCFMLLFKL